MITLVSQVQRVNKSAWGNTKGCEGILVLFLFFDSSIYLYLFLTDFPEFHLMHSEYRARENWRK